MSGTYCYPHGHDPLGCNVCPPHQFPQLPVPDPLPPDGGMHHLHIGCSDEGAEFNVTLTDADVAGIRKLIAAYEALPKVDDGEYVGPWITLDDPERCYRQSTYGRKDGKWQLIATEELPRDPACCEWWLQR